MRICDTKKKFKEIPCERIEEKTRRNQEQQRRKRKRAVCMSKKKTKKEKKVSVIFSHIWAPFSCDDWLTNDYFRIISLIWLYSIIFDWESDQFFTHVSRLNPIKIYRNPKKPFRPSGINHRGNFMWKILHTERPKMKDVNTLILHVPLLWSYCYRLCFLIFFFSIKTYRGDRLIRLIAI